jgi:flagella basal body P-ring formation protein FlgA
MARATHVKLTAALSMLLVLWTLAAAQERGSAAKEQPVLIRLQARPRVADSVIAIGHVAVVEGGRPELCQRVAALDVGELSDSGELSLTQEGIAYRVQLAGIEARQFRVVGAARAIVSRAPQELSEASLFDAAKRALLRKVPVPADEVSIKLAQPVTVPGLLISARDRVRLEAELPAAGRPLGKVVMEVTVYLNDKQREVVPVYLDVLLYQELVFAKRRIDAGEMLTPELLHFDRRAVDGGNNYLVKSQALNGLKAKRTLMPGQALSNNDVEVPAQRSPIVVKARDMVKLVANVGPLRVTTLGEAIEDGQAGQLIRVRNVDSKNIRMGRVSDRGIVEVEY